MAAPTRAIAALARLVVVNCIGPGHLTRPICVRTVHPVNNATIMHTIYITFKDNEQLRLLITQTPFTSERRRDVDFLRTELDRASIVADASHRPTAIRIGSWFEFLDIQTGAVGAHTLCMPGEMPLLEDGLSVDSRFGAAVIGCSAGDEVRWQTPVGWRRILIREVQPARPARACESAMIRPEGVA